MDECPAYVGVLDKPFGKGNSRFLGVSDRCIPSGFRHRNYEVGFDRVLARELSPDFDSGCLHAASCDSRVRSRQIYVLEETSLGVGRGEVMGSQAVGVDDDQLARFDFTNNGRTHDVEGCGLTGDDPSTLESP